MSYIDPGVRERVAQQKREGRLPEAAAVLEALIAEQLESAGHPDPWPFHQAAIVFRKLKDYDAEFRVLRAFAAGACFRTSRNLRLYDRLPKSHKLAGQPDVGPLEQLFEGVAAVVDTETTGFGEGQELIELGIVRFAFNKRTGAIGGKVDEYHGLRQPGCAVDPRARRVHGIADSELRGQSLDVDRVSEMIEGTDLLIAHNAAFDRPFVTALLPLANAKVWTCSLRGIPWQAKGFESRKLSSLLDAHGIDRPTSHRALDDAKALATLLEVRDRDSGESHFRELISGGYEALPRMRRSAIEHPRQVAPTLPTRESLSAPQAPAGGVPRLVWWLVAGAILLALYLLG